MPYARFLETNLEPNFSPLVPAESAEGTYFDYCVWEALAKVGDTEQVFEVLFVVEGMTGLHITAVTAAERGIADEQTVNLYIGTVNELPESNVKPNRVFWIQTKAHVHDTNIVDIDFGHAIVLGFKDILQFFSIQVEGATIEPDDEGNIGFLEKKQIADNDVIIVKKRNVTRPCSVNFR